MKNILFSFVFMLFNFCTSAQMTQIWGTVKSEGFDDTDITLYAIKNGEAKEITKTHLGEDGSFGFMFNPSEEGFYAIGWGEFIRGKFPVYLKRGDKVEVAINHRKFDFIGQQTPENAVLYKWIQMSDSVRYNAFYSMQRYDEFFPALTKLAAQATRFQKAIQTKNVAFNEAMRQVVGYDLDLYALNFFAVPRGEFIKRQQLTPYYNTIVNPKKFKADGVLGMLHGQRFLDLYASFATAGDKETYMNSVVVSRKSVDEKITAFNNDHVKGAYILNKGKMPTDYKAYLDYAHKYGQYFQTKHQKSIIEELGTKLYSKEAGPKPAANFTYPDQNGKMVSLSDFKGEVVIVDVWATWCAPCKAEIPYLKKLEQEFKDKKVVFISVSVDYEKDKQKWVAMLKGLNLHGIQLFAGGWTKITKDYAIGSIPRFMVFDKRGYVVSTDSPRPSDPRLKALLEKELLK